jgi:prophage regulatory protein
MRLLSRDDLKSRGVTFGDSQFYELINRGLFPKPVKIGLRRNAWVESEIDAWMKARVDERDRGAA